MQAIPVIAEQAGHLTVFQRTPNYTMPAGNRPLTDTDRKRAKAKYHEIRESERESLAGIIFGFGGHPLPMPTESSSSTSGIRTSAGARKPSSFSGRFTETSR